MKLSPMVLISRPWNLPINLRLCAKCARRTSFVRSSFRSSPKAVELTTSVKTIAKVTRSSPAQSTKSFVLVSPRAETRNASKSRRRLASCSHRWYLGLEVLGELLLRIRDRNQVVAHARKRLLSFLPEDLDVSIRHGISAPGTYK